MSKDLIQLSVRFYSLAKEIILLFMIKMILTMLQL